MTEIITDPVELAYMAAAVDQDNQRVFPELPRPRPVTPIDENDRQGNYEQDTFYN